MIINLQLKISAPARANPSLLIVSILYLLAVDGTIQNVTEMVQYI